ncbi:MAG: hypothetical protein V1686_01655 [Patescibacteria group bacterium]
MRESGEPKPKIKQEKLIDSEPGLKDIYKTLGLLDGYTEWKKDLPEKVGPWENSLELFENVQRVVLEQIQTKVDAFQGKVSSIQDLPREEIIDTIVNNWPEGIPEIQGQRREVLLAVAGHVIKHMETRAYQEVINCAEEKDLEKLGLNSELRDVTTKLLDASMRADNLFIRFLAFSRLSPKPKEGSLSTKFYLPGDETAHTINELFDKDAQYLFRKFKEISEMSVEWKKFPGGEIFQKYLIALSESYREKDVNKTDECYRAVSELYKQSTFSDFPILIVPTEYTGGYFKPPYFDPEIKITLRSPEEEKNLSMCQEVISRQLKEMGHAELAKNVIEKKFTVVNSIGDYGAGLAMKTTAQMGESVGMVFLAEQRKLQNSLAGKKNFKIGNTEKPYSLRMSFFVTSFHEFCHFHKDGDPGAKRLGADPGLIINEVKAEQFYRQFLPELIKAGAIEGTEEEWASAALENSLEELFDKPEGDEYYYAAVYTLNKLFEQGIVVFDFKTGAATITDVDAFYKINEELSKEVLKLYRDETMNPQKADKWVKNNCKPNKIVKRVSNFIKGIDETEEDLVADCKLPKSPKEGPVKIFEQESAWIKKPDSNNPNDIDAYKRIEDQPIIKKWMDDAEELSTTEEIKKMFKKQFYGVCGEKEKGLMEGFVWLYELEEDTITNLKESRLIDLSGNSKILEISFARLLDENLPEENKGRGHIPSAIRQIGFSLLEKSEETTIVAFTNPKNLLSEGVLKNSGFKIRGKVFYDINSKEQDNFWVLDKQELEKILKKKK